MKTTLWLGAGVLFLAAHPFWALGQNQGGKADKLDPAKLVGTWHYVSGEKNGQMVDKESFKNAKVTITKETITLDGDQGKFVMTYTLDLKKNPVALAMKMTEGIAEGATSEGIIEVKGDDLKLCYAPSGEKPPTKFEAKEGSNYHFFVLKRSTSPPASKKDK